MCLNFTERILTNIVQLLTIDILLAKVNPLSVSLLSPSTPWNKKVKPLNNRNKIPLTVVYDDTSGSLPSQRSFRKPLFTIL